MKILSIDLSLNCPGFCYYDGYSITFHDHIKMKSKLTSIEKVDISYKYVEKLIIMLEPDIILLEHCLSNHNKTKNSTLISLGGVNTCIQLCAYRNKVKVDLIWPISWKSFIKRYFGIKEFPKDDICKYVNKYFGTNISSNDEGDACAMIMYYLEK